MSTQLDDAIVDPTSASAAHTTTSVRARHRRPRRTVMTWSIIAVLGAAAALLVASGLRPDQRATDVGGVSAIARHGSISAVDHRDAQTVDARHTPGQTIADHGSISAADHRDAQSIEARHTPARTIGGHSSISARDRRGTPSEPQ